MNKFIALSLTALVCCVTIAYGNMYQMYNPKGYMYPGGYSYGGAGGFNPVGQGGIMQFFFMLIFLVFILELFRGFGDGYGSGGGGHKGGSSHY